MQPDLPRRDFVKQTALLGAAAAALRAVGNARAAEQQPGELPKIRLGNLEVSRLILGSNPFFGYAHQPGDIGRQMVEYYTDARITEVLTQAADSGITAVAAPPEQRWIKLFNRYLDQGGKLHMLDRPAARGPGPQGRYVRGRIPQDQTRHAG